MEDLAAHDSQLLSVASAEGIDVTTKLALAQETIAVELTGMLNEGGGPRLEQVVATPLVRLWHAFRALEMVYRDAYNNQLNDRYAAKRDQFRGLGDWAREQLRQAGVGIVLRPVPRAAAPDVVSVSGNLDEGTYSATIAWVNAAGEVGASAAPVTVPVSGGGFVVTPAGPPNGVSGWNVYAGVSADRMSKQNGAPLACGSVWEQSGALINGSSPSAGQAPDYMHPLPRRLQRG
jgi:hypothetical protein